MANIVQQFLRREASPVIQFIKYGLAGGVATAVDLSITFILSWKFIPALTSNDKLVELFNLSIIPVDEAVRPQHYFINCAVAFMVANFVAYVVNVLWVFESGRHSRAKEIGLFYAVSAVSFLVGTGFATALIRFMGFTTSVAKIANLFASVMINYVCRKFIIFKN